MATNTDKIRRDLEKLVKTGTATEKSLAQAVFILNDDLRNISARTAALEKKVADLEKRLR